MKIKLTQATAKHFVSKDVFRPSMQGIYIDVKNQKAVMTNGTVMLIVNIEVDETIENSFIMPISSLPKKKEAEVTFDGTTITTIELGQPTIISAPIAEYYPDYMAVKPKFDDERVYTPMISLNPSFFAGFACAAKNFDGNDITLEIFGAEKAIKITPIENDSWEGLLMPRRKN